MAELKLVLELILFFSEKGNISVGIEFTNQSKLDYHLKPEINGRSHRSRIGLVSNAHS